MTRDGKATKYISFCLLTILLGFAAGGIVWVILQIMQIGIGLIWTAFPTALGLGPGVLGVLLYNLIVCFIGALFIALGQKHYGPKQPYNRGEKQFRQFFSGADRRCRGKPRLHK